MNRKSFITNTLTAVGGLILLPTSSLHEETITLPEYAAKNFTEMNSERRKTLWGAYFSSVNDTKMVTIKKSDIYPLYIQDSKFDKETGRTWYVLRNSLSLKK